MVLSLAPAMRAGAQATAETRDATRADVALPELNANSEAEAFFKEGNRLFARAMARRGQARETLLAQALERYARSLRIVRSRNAVYNTAIALVEADKPTEAFGYFHEYLLAEDLSDAERADALRRLDVIKARVALVEVRSTPDDVAVRVDRLDHAPRGHTPLTMALAPGEHQLHLSKRGFADLSTSLTLQAGETRVLERALSPYPIAVRLSIADGARALLANEQLTLGGTAMELGARVELPPGEYPLEIDGHIVRLVTLEPGSEEQHVTFSPPPLKTGSVLVTSATSVTVTSSDHILGSGTDVRMTLPEGEHTLVITSQGYAPLTVAVQSRAGRLVQVNARMVPVVTPTRFGSLPTYGFYAAGSLGALGLATGVYALMIQDEYRAQPTKKRADTLDRVNLTADIFFAAGIITGGAALILYLLEEEAGPQRSTATTQDMTPPLSVLPHRLHAGPTLSEGRPSGWFLTAEWHLRAVEQ